MAIPLLGMAMLATACAPAASAPTAQASSGAQSARPSPSPTASSSPSPSPTPAPPHVFIIVLENRSYQAAMADPYIASLAGQYALATNYHAVSHPSLPNYLALTSGSTWGIQDDGYHVLPPTGLAAELTNAGIPWRAYLEGFNGNCLRSPYPYALKHNPFAYYGGQCPAGVVPFAQLQADLSSSMPQFAWIGPDMCHSGHDCSTATAAQWLSSVVPQITASPAWSEGGTLYITWDENDGAAGNQVPLIVIAPHLATRTTGISLDHFALVATMADQLGVARPGQTASAPSVAQAFGIGG